MSWWHLLLALILCSLAGVVAGVGIGTARRNDLREEIGQLEDQADKAYDKGWDACVLAMGRASDHLTAVLSTGRGAADDEIPAPLPEPMLDPDCRDGKHRSCIGGPCECPCHVEDVDEVWPVLTPREAARDLTRLTEGEDWRETMRRELAPDWERPATRTEQFRAVFSQADGLERECLLTWDLARRFERTRAADLREAGISEQRIRELLGAG